MTAAKENYLKVIYNLIVEGQAAQVSPIAASLGITRASVSRMLKDLEQDGLIEHKRYGPVYLTNEGMKIAEIISNRNRLIQDFLMRVLGLDQDIALRDACKIEHTISYMTTLRLAAYLQMVGSIEAPRKSK